MSAQPGLEITGNISDRPFADMVAEIAQSSLTGSLRLSSGDKKSIAYFRAGKLVFAVSNARSARLFDILLREKRVSKDDVVKAPNFANDIEFSKHLVESGKLNDAECTALFQKQLVAIVRDLMVWLDGEWSFSSLMRIRDGLEFNIGQEQILADYARTISVAAIWQRFTGVEEKFRRRDGSFANLTPDETALLSILTDEPQTTEHIINRSGVSPEQAIRNAYVLWMTGMADRLEWRSAFTPEQVAAMNGAKLELKQAAIRPAAPVVPEISVEEQSKTTVQKELTLDEYLERVEAAETFYDVLGIDPTAEIKDLKQSYFTLAKAFHPDRFYKSDTATLKRVQDAFAQLASAHETLRSAESRELYDFKVRKELAERIKNGGAPKDAVSQHKDQAEAEFEAGYNYLVNGEFMASLPHLARAVHYDPSEARYHSYYGKALSNDEKFRHKAEAELQAAIKIDPSEPLYRIALVEFFIKMNLLRRAEGELNRMLSQFPNNSDALALLSSLK